MKKRLLAILLGLVLLFTSIPFGAADDDLDALPTDGDILSDETEEIDLPDAETPDEEPYAEEPYAFLPPAVSDEPEGAIDIPETPSDASGSCGDNLTWTFTESTGTLTITGSGKMNNFTQNTQPWSAYLTQIKKVVIGNGVTSIGNSAFGGCSNLADVSIPKTVTKIGSDAFNCCYSLTSITLPDNLTSLGTRVFYKCNLQEITIPDRVSIIPDYGFYNNLNLQSVTLGNGTAEIRQYAFGNCNSLAQITIPANASYIESTAFYGCTGLTDIFVDEGNASFCDVDGVVYSKDLKTLKLYPAGSPRTSYEVPDGVTTIAICAFYRCQNVTSITLPGSLTSISNDAFAECTARLKDVYYYGTKSMRDEISIGSSNNERLINATWHYLMPYSIEIKTLPDKCTYCLDQPLDTTGGTLTVRYDPDIEEEEPITVDMVSGYAAGETGVHTLTVTFKSLTTTYDVTVNPHVPGDPSYENEVPSTCIDHGHYDEVVCCTVCGKELSREQKELPLGDHTPGEPVYENGTAPTCTEDGYAEEVIYCAVCGKELSREEKAIPATGHAWGEPTYVWAGDNTSVTASRVCANDASHVETETVRTTSEVTKPATYTEPGETTYTATFANPAFETQIKTVEDIPILTLDAAVEWSAEDVQFKGATAYVIANGSAQTPRFTVINKTDGSTVDPANYDYEYKENTNAGTGYVFVTFKNGLSGTCRGSFKIYLPATTATTVENTADGIKVTWEPVEGAAGYVIYRRAWSSTTNGWTTFARWDNTTATIYTDGADANHKVYAGTRYQYGVKAYFARRTDPVTGAAIGGNVNNDSGNFNLGLVGPLKTTVRITTRTATSATLGTEKVTVKWQPSSLFTGYQIQSATNIQFTQNVQLVTVGSPSATQRVVTGLKSNSYTGTSYYFRVRSYQKFEGMTYYGGWSNIVTARSMPKYRALLIGQNKYASSPLYGCVNDAQSMMGMLFGLKNKYVTMAYSNAYAAAIIADIRGLAKDTTKDSVSLFYYSGHGMSSNDNNVLGGLVGVDNTYIPLSMLANELNKVNGRVIVILDSCHSGATIDKSLNGENVLDAFNNEVIDAFAGYDLETGVRSKDAKLGEFKKSKFIVITAASKTQTSLDGYFDGSGYRQGAFTAAIIKGMACKYPSGVRISYTSTAMPADSNGDRNVTLKELFSYAYRTAHHWAGGDANAQRAQYYGPDAEVLFSR